MRRIAGADFRQSADEYRVLPDGSCTKFVRLRGLNSSFRSPAYTHWEEIMDMPRRALSIARSIAIGVLIATASTAQDAPARDGKSCALAAAPVDKRALKDQLHREVIAGRGRALVGVDALGRVAIAIDSDRDGMSNMLILFTAKDRLQGPWSKDLPEATFQIREGSVLLASRQHAFALTLAASLADPPVTPGWASEVIVQSEGRELARNWGAPGFALASLNHNSIQS